MGPDTVRHIPQEEFQWPQTLDSSYTSESTKIINLRYLFFELELDKAEVHVIRLVSFWWLWFSVYPLMEKDKRLMEAS